MAAPHLPLTADPALLAAKKAARDAALARRAEADPGAGARLATFLLTGFPPPAGALVAGYWPIGSEIDVRPLLRALAARGHALALPEAPARGQPLLFRRWSEGDALAPGRFGTAHPSGALCTPDFLLVPLLAFDRRGHRLGYGAGYYDRTLATLPHAIAVGCAHAGQECAEVPAGPHDVRLDAIATDAGVIVTKGR